MATLPTTTLTANWDASDSAGLWENHGSGGSVVPSDGDAVERWDPEGVSNGLNMAYIGATEEPLWQDASSDMLLPCLKFDGSNDGMISKNNSYLDVQMDTLIDADGFTIAVSFRISSVTLDNANKYDNHPIWVDFSRYLGVFVRDDAGQPKIYGYIYSGGANYTPDVNISVNTDYVVVFRYDGTNMYINVNDAGETVAQATGNPGSIAGEFKIGDNNNAYYLTGSIGEIAIYDSGLTGTDLTNLNTYFNDKWVTGGGGGRTMGSLVGSGGLVGTGGIAGEGGGIAG